MKAVTTEMTETTMLRISFSATDEVFLLIIWTMCYNGNSYGEGDLYYESKGWCR